MYDVIIIGAGVSGSASARELSKYNLNILVLDKESDVCEGTSKANSGIVHAGYDAMPGTLMAKLNVEGNRLMPKIAKDLDIPFRRNGSLVVCTDPENMDGLQKLYDRGIANGVEGMRIINREELRAMEPNISDDAVAALYAPSAGIICPFTLNIALAENANTNGVEFRMNEEVRRIEKTEHGYLVSTGDAVFETKVVVNAAGVYGDVLHNMVSEDKKEIIPRRGEYLLLDHAAGSHVTHTVFALPTKLGKGILVSPTAHDNLIVGPTALNIDDKEGVNTTRAGLDEVISKSPLTVKNLPLRSVITSFAGLRAHLEEHDFIIRELEESPGFVDCIGIESPGLTASVAIGNMVADIVAGILHPEKKENWIGTRKGIVNPNTLSNEERNALIAKQPAYGNIVCRCEMVSEGEILDAIHRPLGATTLDGVKRRTRAGMGRCQAGFCSPKTMEILSREWNVPVSEVTKSGKKSRIIVGTNKEDL